MPTVRDAVLRVLRSNGVGRLFANPGSTEVALLAHLPDDLELVLGLHEAVVVGMATGEALGSGRPAVALLHTTAGLGNAVGALATARENRAPLVVLVGQQDRRHLASTPFLAGRLRGLAGDYPVAVLEPVRAADVPALVARAFHVAAARRGPAVVLVPMDDWAADAEAAAAPPAPAVLRPACGPDPGAVAEAVAAIEASRCPALVTGSGADGEAAWAATAALADRLGCPVWMGAHAARAGFDQTSAAFAGHLPAARGQLRDALAGHDLVIVVGGPAFTQYLYDEGSFVAEGTDVLVLTDDVDEAARSAARLAVVGDVAATVSAVASSVARRDGSPSLAPRAAPAAPGAGALEQSDVLAALGRRLPADAVVVEESPSTRRLVLDLLPARRPGGFHTPAMGGLGFALPAAAGLRLAQPDRPVVAVVGDGASLYTIQALWSAQRYGAGVLYVVMANGAYAVMDRLAAAAGSAPAWPAFPEVSISTLARGLGCDAERIATRAELDDVLDRVVPGLAARRRPLVLDVAVPT
jgi:benzoylformate decarboxylase